MLDPPPTPESILQLEGGEADELFDELEGLVPSSPALADLPDGLAHEAVVFGDSHGDWRSTVLAAQRFLDDPADRCLIGLGDYVDRSPPDCGEGSVANALYLLSLVALYPDRVFLLQGNHEKVREIPVAPEGLSEEVDLLWGPDPARYGRLLGLLERGPLALLAPDRAYFAHAGFPRGPPGKSVRERFGRVDEELLFDLLWRECGASRIRRGVSPPFTQRELHSFLDALPAGVFLRGHDPDLSGRSVFADRCLTLHTSRYYERFGGVLLARVPLDRPVRTSHDVAIEHLDSEGREYPDPPLRPT